MEIGNLLPILSDHPARGAIGNRIGWNVSGHHAPGPDHHIVTDGNTRHNNDAAADPDMISNVDRSGLGFAEGKGAILSLSAESVTGIGGVKRGVDLHIWSNEGVIPDADRIVIQKCTVHIYFAVVAKENVISVIHIKGRGNPEVFSHSPQKLA